jgi:reverse transcriptase-like protein
VTAFFDAVNAFFNARLEEDVFMKMPPGHRRNGTILKLNKALYGLRQSPLLWKRELTQTPKKLGLEPISHEPCCVIRSSQTFFYVDDIVIVFRKHQEAEARSLIEKLLTGGDNLQWFWELKSFEIQRKESFGSPNLPILIRSLS